MATPLTATQLADAIGVTPASVLRWAREGLIPCHRVGARVWFVADEVNAATLQAAVAPKVIARETPEPQLPARLFEIIGRQARGAAAQAQTKKKARRA